MNVKTTGHPSVFVYGENVVPYIMYIRHIFLSDPISDCPEAVIDFHGGCPDLAYIS